jgi:hypothetical protein
MAPVAFAASEARSPSALEVEVSLAASESSPTIRFKISNPTTNAMEFNSADLPWASRYSVILTLVENDAGHTVVAEELPVVDPVVGTQSIPPGGVLQGKVVLSVRFRDLLKVLTRHEIILFWSYQPKPLNGPAPPRCGGWLVIPKAQQRKGA